MRTEQLVQKYVDMAVSQNDTAEGAAHWLAIFVANEAVSGGSGRVRAHVLEAYRRVRAMADQEATQ